MSEPTKVVAVRGAVQADENSSPAILSATEKLMSELISRNGLDPEKMISAIFTTTDDLDAE
ncbi:MAG: chorismate mutase, partial [Solirubrobacterales bacterium]